MRRSGASLVVLALLASFRAGVGYAQAPNDPAVRIDPTPQIDSAQAPTSDPAEPPKTDPAEPPQIDPAEAEIAFRFSEPFFASLMRRRVDRTTPVSRCVLGAAVSGSARTVGAVEVLFQRSPTEAQFYVVMAGQTVSNTVSVKGPARVSTQSTTTFRVWKLVRFDGERFVATPAGVESRTCQTTTGIASTARLRLVNRIVRRAAARRISQVRGYTTNLESWETRKQLLTGFNAAVDGAMRDANERLSIRETLLARFGDAADLKYSFSTTDRYLEIYVNVASDVDPKRPPIVEDWRFSPMEIWVHSYLEDELLPPILSDWAPRYRFFIERSAERLAERLTPEQVEFQLQFTPQLDWVVMRFGDELMERIKTRIQERRPQEQR
jgi:hypothetical protein